MPEPKTTRPVSSARPWQSPLAQALFGRALLHTASQFGDAELAAQGLANLKAVQSTSSVLVRGKPTVRDGCKDGYEELISGYIVDK